MRRRAFLRGAGTVAIALPFLEELAGKRVSGQPAIPERFVTLFFGLGLDPAWQRDFSGPLQPLMGFADRMATFSVGVQQGDTGGAHCNTSTVIFVGERQRSVNVAGGPSLDQRIRAAVDPSAPTLASGLWWRRGACDAQALRVYNPDGSSRSPVKRPTEVFDDLFGSYVPPPDPDPSGPDPDVVAMNRERRIEQSILDTVMEQYRHYRGDRSPLGAGSKLKVEQHLQSIREIERQLAPAEIVIDRMDGPTDPTETCMVPEGIMDPDIGADVDRFTYGTGDGAPALHWQDAQRLFRLHADLWAVALRCDLLRYGNLMFESAGGHMNLHGTYSAMGDSTDFPGTSQHDSYFHDNQPTHARLYQHYAMSNLGYFLELLDDPEHAEENGRSVLENTTVLIGTEYGWNHSKEDVFHAVVGGVERFRSGSFVDLDLNCIDLYNAILEGYGLPADVGSATDISSVGDATGLLR